MGTASGITLGLTVSVGGLISPVIGKLAEATSLQTALAPLVVTPLISWMLFRGLSDPAEPRRDIERTTADTQSPTVVAP